ncbi:clotting factor G beta subunit-like [Adelges cooleyi]|uniref:clotting factor G beta subunit-like n=1 Tax=Adelges cooleyi TaxID=133065 RepID=UPI00217F58A9|nr:clotting factor G beta subunit-like [Adelges cooleyi]
MMIYYKFGVLLICFVLYFAISKTKAQVLELDEGDICKRSREPTQPHSVCRRLKDCGVVHEQLKKNIYPRICSYSVLDLVVCCPYPLKKVNTTKVTQPPVKSSPGKSNSAIRKCSEYKNLPFDLLSLGYHEENTDKDKNLNEVYFKEFPHMALIGYGETKSAITWDCGGSLISNRWILSSALCEKIGRSNNFARWVLLGLINTDWIDGEDLKTNLYEIEKRVVHKNYRSTSIYNDIALFRLNRDVEFSETIRPVCLNVDPLFKPSTVTATGWSPNTTVDGRGTKRVKILQKTTLNTISDSECNSIYANDENQQLVLKISDESQICTKYVEDTCISDTGGPLQVKNAGGDYTTYTQVGVTSFGKTCGYKDVPSVYTRVSAYISWIEENVWK